VTRSRDRYNQSGIGDCGHVVGTWPQVTDMGGRNPRVICDTCTREQYGIAPQEKIIVVFLRDDSPKPYSPPRKRRVKPVQDEVLF
jgi:hypothetical protein